MLFTVFLVGREGRGVLALVPVAEPLAVAVILAALRPWPLVWLAAAVVAGLRAAARFTRPGARHARGPRWAAPVRRVADSPSADSVLTGTVWQHAAPKAGDATLRQALELARRNRVEALLARAYPVQLADVLAEVSAAADVYARYVEHVAGCLRRAGVPALLMPGPLPPGHPDAGIDLLTTAEHWPNALELLGGGHAHRGTAGYGRVATACLYPPACPALHLHADTRWLGVPMRPRLLLARARPGKHGLLIPAPPDRLRIRLAEALFQTRVLDLSMLVEVRELLVPDVMTAARAEAEQEGWRADFEEALRAASDAVDRLNHRRPGSPPIPVAGLAPAEQPPGPADRTRPLRAVRAMRHGLARTRRAPVVAAHESGVVAR